jgi:hypothetical protein
MVEEHKTTATRVYSNRKKPDPSVTLFLHENNTVDVEEESCCSAHSTLVSDQNTTFTSLKLHGNVMTLKGTKLRDWPVSTDVACWYDSYPFTTTPVPLPHHYDESKKAFVIYGNVCSVECALAYMHREGRHHDLWERVILFEDMMNKVFQIKVAGREPAPPFLTLTRFGGFFSIEEYRASFQTVQLTVITPPFIMYPLVIQEKYKKTRASSGAAAADVPSFDPVVPEETVLSTGHVLRGLRRPVAKASTAPGSIATTAPGSIAQAAPGSIATATAPLTVEALSLSSSDEEMPQVPALEPSLPEAPALVPPLGTTGSGFLSSSVQQDKDFYSKLTKSGRGRGRGRGRASCKKPGASSHGNNPGSGSGSGLNGGATMLTNFLVFNKK